MPRPSNERLAQHIQSIEAHRRRPDVTLDQHVAGKRAALADEVAQRKRVYLDTRYWIFLRDAALGTPKKPVHLQLLESLRAKVQSGMAICPLGDGSLLEVLKQSDERTRLATARVIDELSGGVTVLNAIDRFAIEVEQFFEDATRAVKPMMPPFRSVWVKAAYALGMLHPRMENVSEADNLALAKAFFDLMWSMTVEELLEETPELPAEIGQGMRDTASMLTTASREHVSEIRDWPTLYADEILGFFDACGPVLEEVMVARFRRQNPGAPQPQPSGRSQLVRFFAEAVRLGKAGRALPQAQIEAGVHAIIRWHKTRPFSEQDFVDMHHATAALPYCDIFLTERFLGTALSRAPLNLANHFGVQVVWREEEAVAAIERLESRERPV